jgi:hypothetical protein
VPGVLPAFPVVLILRIVLLGHRYNRGVDDLAAACKVARGREMLAEAHHRVRFASTWPEECFSGPPYV